MAKTLLPLAIGVVLSFMGVAVTEFASVSITETVPLDERIPGIILLFLLGFGIVSLIFGAILLVVHFYVRRKTTELYLPESATVLALNVAVEFMIGAWLAVVGITNFDADAGPEGLPWSFITITVLGTLLVVDSALLYRSHFNRAGGKKSGN